MYFSVSFEWSLDGKPLIRGLKVNIYPPSGNRLGKKGNITAFPSFAIVLVAILVIAGVLKKGKIFECFRS